MDNIGYYNGQIGPIEDIRVPMDDRGGIFGDGVYDATMAYDRIVVNMEEHIARFFESARLVRIPMPWSVMELSGLLTDLAGRVSARSKMVYWQATRGTGPRKHSFAGASAGPNLWITVRPLELTPLDGSYSAITRPDLRYALCHVKTINLLPNVLTAQEAAEHGCDEAILMKGGLVTEGTRHNIHILKDGALHTAPCDHRILPGIARQHLLTHARRLNIPVMEQPFDVSALMAADEVIMTSSASLCCAIRKVDGQAVGGRDSGTLKQLQQAVYHEYLADTGQIVPK